MKVRVLLVVRLLLVLVFMVVLHWARGEPDLEPLYLDLQGVANRQGFFARLAWLREDMALAQETRDYLASIAEGTDPYGLLRGLANAVGRGGRLPLFLLNEVDRLFADDPDFVLAWRGMHDQGLARFVMVGYSVIGRMSTLGRPDSPFFHFTVGTDFGGKAISLGALSKEAAEGLLDLLESEPLGLRWADEQQKQAAYGKLLDHSYCIPWILQRYGQLLVERLDEERRDYITHQDAVEMIARGGSVAWQYIHSIEYGSLGSATDQMPRVGLELVLYALARSRYFLGADTPPIKHPRLRERRPLDDELGFTVDEARSIVQETIRGLLVAREYVAFEHWFDDLDLEEAFRLLTLTLALEPDPESSDRYGFLLHIVPLELYGRWKDDDPTLDNLIIRQAEKLLLTVDKPEANR